jgi:hypothetical protein
MKTVEPSLLLKPLDALIIASWAGPIFLPVLIPLFYVVRRAELNREHAPQIHKLKEFAAADPNHLIHQSQGTPSEETPEPAREIPVKETWFVVLGVSPSATIGDVKQAYKVLIKQNHPDRVQFMSPIFKVLAEAETKKLNDAYAEALMLLRQEGTHPAQTD